MAEEFQNQACAEKPSAQFPFLLFRFAALSSANTPNKRRSKNHDLISGS